MTCTISKFGITNGPSHEFYINLYYENSLKRIPIKYSSIFDKRIGLLYSSILPFSEIGVSFDTYRAIAGIPSDEILPIQKIKVKISNNSEAAAIASRIRQSNMNIDAVWDYSELKANIDRI